MKKEEIIAGIAKILKFSEIPNPRLKRNPAANGPITAPNLPAPIDQPMPVFLNSVGYILAAKAYRPTKPPWTKNPKTPKTISIIFEPRKKFIFNINNAVRIRKAKIVFLNQNNEEMNPWVNIPKKAPILNTTPE